MFVPGSHSRTSRSPSRIDLASVQERTTASVARKLPIALKLPRGRRSRPGARLVLARIVEKGVHGPKTSGAVVALAIRR